MNNENLIAVINKEMDLAVPAHFTDTQLHSYLSGHINSLIINDFPKLTHLLYRIDVNEKKLKALLRESPDHNAGDIIAAVIIERTLQKIKSRTISEREKPEGNPDEWL